MKFYLCEWIIKNIFTSILVIFTAILCFLSPILIPILFIDTLRDKNSKNFPDIIKEYFCLGWTFYKEILL